MPPTAPLLALAFAAPAGPEAAPPPRPAPLVTAGAVRRLPPAEAGRRRPVRVTGVVTHSNPRGDFWVQDETAGVYVHPTRLARGLRPGDRVTVAGATDPGAFAPSVRAASVTPAGPGRLPDPQPYDLNPDDARWLDGQFVQAWAVAEGVETKPGFTLVRVHSGRGVAAVWVPGEDRAGEAGRLVGAGVRVRGVAVAGVDADRLVTRPARIFSADLPAPVAAPAGARPPAPVRAADLLRAFVPDPHPVGRRVTAAGVVTAHPYPDLLFVQDDGVGLTAGLDPPPAGRLAAGTRVEVAGTLDVRGPRLRLARAAVVRVVGPGPAPAPAPADPRALAAGAKDGTLVRVSGHVTTVRRHDGETAVQVDAGAAQFAAVLAGSVAPDRAPVGALVEAVGVPTDNPDFGPPADGFAVLLRSAADLTVLEPPPPPPAEPWWTPRRTAAVVGGFTAVCLIGGGWVWLLRVQVRRQTAALRHRLVTEAALEARYRDLFETAGDAVWVTDPAGNLAELNRAGEKLLNVGRAEAVGRPLADYLPPDQAGPLRDSQVGQSAAPFELAVVPKGGRPRAVEVTSRALPDGGVQTVARDVTDRKEFQDRLRRVEKLEAVGRLAGGVAHDFNNLLTVINGNAELLRDLLPPGGPGRGLADEVLAAAGRAADLTRRLLTFGRQRFVTPGPVDLNGAVAEAAGLLRRLVGAGVAVVTDLAPDAPWVTADAGLVDQILLNLAVNARDAMPAGGTMTIRTARAADGRARLTVEDTGVGMTDEVKARVFEPFFTTKPVGQGTGLGLATVYGAVQTLGGAVRFTSEVGRGTAFEVDLPAADGAPAGPPPGPPAGRPWGRGRTALLVEDDDPVRGLIRGVLEGAGLTVLEAAGGPAAEAVSDRHPGPVDVLVTDVRMPHMTGVELAARLRAARPGLRVVFVSGYPGAAAAGLAGEEAFVPKPFAPADLAATVRGVLLAPGPAG